MIIANQLRERNRAEYLLYLWQVEDILRAYNCDVSVIEQEYVSRFRLSEVEMEAVRKWYADLCEMMRSEGVRERGHLQLSKNVLSSLDELHRSLLASEKFPYYREMYYRVLPYIVELRGKGVGTQKGELEACFEALYGILVLRLKKAPVGDDTLRAQADITTLLGQLSDYWFKDQHGDLHLDD